MKRIISTLLSLSLVLSLLPTVALAEGESSGLHFQAPDSLTVGESDYVIAADENYEYVKENVTWTNSDNTIVQVEPITDDEWAKIDPSKVDRSAIVKVTALQAGEAKIQATTASGKTGTYTITVTAPVPVTSVKLDKDELTCDSFEESYFLNCTVYPDDATNTNVKWVSSDPDVVQVYSSGDRRGQVVPQKPGTATITVSAQENPALTYDCIVTVTATRPVESISLNYSEWTFTDWNEKPLHVNFVPTNATNRNVTWKSDNESVATVSKSGDCQAAGTRPCFSAERLLHQPQSRGIFAER